MEGNAEEGQEILRKFGRTAFGDFVRLHPMIANMQYNIILQN
jgi:hypothetical protein